MSMPVCQPTCSRGRLGVLADAALGRQCVCDVGSVLTDTLVNTLADASVRSDALNNSTLYAINMSLIILNNFMYQ